VRRGEAALKVLLGEQPVDEDSDGLKGSLSHSDRHYAPLGSRSSELQFRNK
jgi:hypothetical protein